MKIVIIGPAHPLRGGIATFNERLSLTLSALGHESQIISYSLQYPSILFPGKTQYDQGLPPENLAIHSLINSINPLSWYSAAKFIADSKPDLIIIRFWIPFMAPALGTMQRILFSKGMKTIALVDNLIPHEKRPGDRFLTKYFMKRIEKYVVMSKEVENDVLRLKPSVKTLYQPHPIYDHYGNPVSPDVAKKFLHLPVNYSYILFFGLIRKYKGLDLLFDAFSKSKNKENIKIIIAGEFYEDKNEYLALADKLKISQNLYWFDHFIPNEEVKYYFSACNLLALPYRTATQSGVTQVALHFETPVLVTDVGGLSEIIHHDINGLVAAPNIDSITSNLDYFFENERENVFRKGMKEEKSKYSWESFASAILKFSG